ncbi:MAG TPA: TetR/AcrR family transcriptional regulator [Bacteroidales bacterium]|nr:TetR/AcrR family transcriptional regulator [Bacteroidales bacterium]HRZ21467.1 TetR/AcrR family transcriptional regulator [Bacteroidales bacterium]
MAETREIIIDQAYRLFLSRSYEAVSIQDISKSVGLTKGALYHHFLNKEELFKAVIDKYLKLVGLIQVRQDITLEEYIQVIIEYVSRIVQTICIDGQSFIPVKYLLLLIDALRHYPGYMDEQRHFYTLGTDHLKTILDRAVKNGEIRGDIDTSLVALNFTSIALGVAASLFREHSTQETIQLLRSQMVEYYKILKK